MTKNTFDKHLRVQLVNSKKGYCRVKLNLKPNLLNAGGIAHGGVLATLCDIALAGAIANSLKKHEWCLTVELSIKFMNPAFPGKPIYGYGRLVKRGNTLAFVEGGIETKDKRQIARAHGIWIIKSKPIKGIKKAKKLE